VKVIVDRVKCTGLGICESLAPNHFEVNEDGVLVLLDENVSDEDRSSIEEAIAGCPTEALRLAQ
jgi:ferredoxin